MALWFGTQLRETAKNAVDFSKHAKNGCTLQFERFPHRLPSVPTGGWEKHGRTTLHKSWHSHLDGLGFKQKRVLGPKHTHYSHWSTGNYFKPLMSHLWTMAMGQNFPAPFSHQNRWVLVHVHPPKYGRIGFWFILIDSYILVDESNMAYWTIQPFSSMTFQWKPS